MQIFAPNYTQTPNIFFDDMAKTLKEGELRVLLIIMRQTFGWRKKWDRISLKQMERKTGMCHDAVVNSIKSLIEKKIISKHQEGSNGTQKTWYTLIVEEVEEEPEIPDEFDENSNNFDQSSKTTPTSRFRRPTKETITKEILTPTVPKGDPPKRQKIKETKKEVASRVYLTDTQETDLLKRCKNNSEMLAKCYDELSSWKIGKGIIGGKNDYKSIVDWVINKVEENNINNIKNKKNEVNNNLFNELKISSNFEKAANATVGYNYIEFNLGRDVKRYLLEENNFAQMIKHELVKRGLWMPKLESILNQDHPR